MNRHVAENLTSDAAALAVQPGKLAEQSQRLIQDFLLDRPDIAHLGMGDISALGGPFLELTTKLMADPGAVARTQINLFNDSLRLWQTKAERLLGQAATKQPPDDKRFKHPADRERGLLFQGELSHFRQEHSCDGARRRRAGPSNRSEGRLLCATVRRRAELQSPVKVPFPLLGDPSSFKGMTSCI